MRKTIMLGTLIALFSAGALAHARGCHHDRAGNRHRERPGLPCVTQDDGRERHPADTGLVADITRPVTATANIMTKLANATTRAGNTAGAADRHRNEPTDGTPEAFDDMDQKRPSGSITPLPPQRQTAIGQAPAHGDFP